MEVLEQVLMSPVSADRKMTIYRDGNSMMEYFADTVNKTCYKVNMTAPAPTQFCEGDKMPNLKMLESLKIDGEMADVYELTYPDGRITFTMMRESFEPVTTMVEQRFNGVGQFIALQNGNVTMGLMDEKVFEMPSFCKGI